MATKSTKTDKPKTVETLTHEEASRKNIPTAEFQSVMRKDEQTPIRVAYERRNRDMDPQLVWRGKDEQDWSDLVTHAPPLYIQEKGMRPRNYRVDKGGGLAYRRAAAQAVGVSSASR
jgi:adenine-specific DNA-methyltransferase